jgi:hypothetical protein
MEGSLGGNAGYSGGLFERRERLNPDAVSAAQAFRSYDR